MAQKIYDLAVKTGTYTDAAGQQKNRYQNIGAVLKGDDGNPFMLLDPLINIGAIQREAGKDRVLVSMFKPNDQAGGQPQRQAPAPARRPAPVDDSDVPFN